MRFGALILLALALAAGPPRVTAQDPPPFEESAARETLRAAFVAYAEAETVTGQLVQTIDQVLTLTLGQETVTLTQAITMEGTTTLQQVPGARYPNFHTDLIQSIDQRITGTDVDNHVIIGPTTFNMRAVDDRLYLRVEADDPALAAQFPDGWRDVTDSTSGFPGLSLYNIEGLMNTAGNRDAAYFEGLLDAGTAIESEPRSPTDADTLSRFRLTLDPAQALELVGLETVTGVFNQDGMPIDVSALIEQMLTGDGTAFTIRAAVDTRTNALVELTEEWTIDLIISPDMITDPVLEGATIAVQQHMTQTLVPTAMNEPVTIDAPEIAG